MQVIPVIDLKNGIVVHARQGQRESYAPVRSVLSTSSDAIAVVDALLSFYPFQVIYIADLDAITGGVPNTKLIKTLLARYSEVAFWLDSGFPIPDDGYFSFANFMPVIGSESLREDDLVELETLASRFVLSLDYSLNGTIGPKSLFENDYYWPERVIVMTLPHVGSQLGPSFGLLQDYAHRHPRHNFVAAGGIRNGSDLDELSRAGIHFALVASALHDGRLSGQDLLELPSNPKGTEF